MDHKEELIEKFFSNTLTYREQQEFNELLRTDPEFKADFQFQKDVKAALIDNQKEHLKSTLEGFEDKFSEKERESKKNFRFLMIAASLVFLLGLGAFFYYEHWRTTPDNLYTDYFEPYRNVVNPIVRGDKNETIEKRAFLAYENSKYHKAINLFSSIKNAPDYIDFYIAMSYMAVDKNMEAAELLRNIADNPEKGLKFQLSEKAHWYLALAYMKSHELEKSREILEQIVNDDSFSFKKEAARELLKDID